MTISIFFFAILATATLACLLAPIVANRPHTVPSRDQIAEEVVKEKIRRIRLDLKDGLLSDAEAKSAEAELGRVLLSSARRAGNPDELIGKSGGKSALVLASVAAVGLGVGLYAWFGEWRYVVESGSAGHASAGSAPSLLSEHEGATMNDAISSLRDRLAQNPSDEENWRLLARTYSAVGAYSEAVGAYEKLIELQPLDIELRGDYAEGLIRAQDGLVGPKAVSELEVITRHEPDDPRALYYLALRDAQAGDSMAAARGWARILRNAPDDAPYASGVRQILNAIIEDAALDRAALDLPAPPTPPRPAPGPTEADIAAASEMSSSDQIEMIKTMVARLEGRLAEEPADIDGWVRLARSKSVLGDQAGAAAALERGLAANPGDPILTQALSAF